VVETHDGAVGVGYVQARAGPGLVDAAVSDVQPVAPGGDVLQDRPGGGQEGEHIEAVEAGLAGTRRPVPQRDVEPAPRVDQPGTAKHAIFDELGPQPQVKELAIPAHAAGKIRNRQLDLRDPVQPGDPGWLGSHLLPPATRRAGPDAVLPMAVWW